MLVVVKVGGRLLEKEFISTIALDAKAVSEANRLILVHGGGREVTEVERKLGRQPRFIVSPDGFRSRYTDRETVEIYAMVMAGKLNKQVVATLQSKNVNAIGLSGLDGRLLIAERKKRLVIINERGRKMVIDGGYTGRIVETNRDLLNQLLDSGYVPVIAPMAMSKEYEPLNVDGDRTAASVAGALNADLLILLTDVEGLAIDGKAVPNLKLAEAKTLLPKIGPGMITKIHAATEALEQGVAKTVIAPGTNASPITSAMNHKVGTVIENA